MNTKRLWYHDESENYYEADEIPDLADSPLMVFVDVTGIDYHELAARAIGVRKFVQTEEAEEMPIVSNATRSLHTAAFSSPKPVEAINERMFRDSMATVVGKLITRHIHPEALVSSCLTCVHFSEHGGPEPGRPAETCAKFRARPPARIIAFGCPSYMDADEIPF